LLESEGLIGFGAIPGCGIALSHLRLGWRSIALMDPAVTGRLLPSGNGLNSGQQWSEEPKSPSFVVPNRGSVSSFVPQSLWCGHLQRVSGFGLVIKVGMAESFVPSAPTDHRRYRAIATDSSLVYQVGTGLSVAAS
jgi:hypothetical protein